MNDLKKQSGQVYPNMLAFRYCEPISPVKIGIFTYRVFSTKQLPCVAHDLAKLSDREVCIFVNT